jgi:hypothetical protein
MAIYLPEVDWPLEQNATLTDYGLPSKLYVLALQKVVISEMLGVGPSRLKDAQLAEACLAAEGKAGDIVCLAGCGALRDISCLVGLEQLQELGISRCSGVDATTVAKVIADNQALSKLIFGGNKVNSWDSEMKPAALALRNAVTSDPLVRLASVFVLGASFMGLYALGRFVNFLCWQMAYDIKA